MSGSTSMLDGSLRILLTLLLATAVGLLHAAPAESRDLFVSTTGDDSTAESWESAYLSIGRALSEADPGDAVHVAAGVYIESVTIPLGVSLLGGHPPQSSGSVVYNRNPRVHTTTIGVPGEFSSIRMRHYSVLDGFEIFGRVFQSNEVRAPTNMFTEYSRITIRVCNIYYESPQILLPVISKDIQLYSSNDLFIENCFIRYSTEQPSEALIMYRSCHIINTILSYDLPLETGPILLAGSGPFDFENCVIYDRGGDRNRPGGNFRPHGRVDSFYVLNTISNQWIGVSGFSAPSPFAVFIARSIYPFATNTFPVHNNRDVDPQFVDPHNDDFRVHPMSPAIDMGRPIPDSLGPVHHDFEGRPRVVDIPGVGGTLEVPPGASALYAIDIGAYEMQLDEYRLRSDFNGDGTVDALDLLIFSGDWHRGTGP